MRPDTPAGAAYRCAPLFHKRGCASAINRYKKSLFGTNKVKYLRKSSGKNTIPTKF